MVYDNAPGLGSNDSWVEDLCAVYDVLDCSGNCVEYNPRVAEDKDLYAHKLVNMKVKRYVCVEDQMQP